MDVVRQKIAAMGGSVEINSEPGRGTRVSLRVPLRGYSRTLLAC